MTRFSANSEALCRAADDLRESIDRLTFRDPVTHVYNPLRYAWKAHQAYLRKAPRGRADAVFLGMNPGPWGMAQTGVPFGEISFVRDFVGIRTDIDKPDREHPKRRIEGFDCQRSEVSGRRFWGYLQSRFGTSAEFFKKNFVINYCPLIFMEASGRNRTPDKLPAEEREVLQGLCDRHLNRVLSVLKPNVVVAVGTYAEACLGRCLASPPWTPGKPTAKSSKSSRPSAPPSTGHSWRIARILHPSPASPAANRDWAGTVERQLAASGIWGRRRPSPKE